MFYTPDNFRLLNPHQQAGEGGRAPGASPRPSQADGNHSPRNLTLPGGGGGAENQSTGAGLAASPTVAGSCGVGQGNVAPDAGYRQSPGDGDPSQGNVRLSGPGGMATINLPEQKRRVIRLTLSW